MKNGNNIMRQLLFLAVVSVLIFLHVFHSDLIKIYLKSNRPERRIRSHFSVVSNVNDPSNSLEKNQDDRTSKHRKCENWIILTTKNKPTQRITSITDALPEWCLLIVGQIKTQENWFNNVTFLSIDEQTELSTIFEIIEKIPYNSYLRKIVGYLYAINNGAKYIYETNENYTTSDSLLGFDYTNFKARYFLIN